MWWRIGTSNIIAYLAMIEIHNWQALKLFCINSLSGELETVSTGLTWGTWDGTSQVQAWNTRHGRHSSGHRNKKFDVKFCMTSMIENLSYCVKGYTISMKTSLDSSFSAIGGHGPHWKMECALQVQIISSGSSLSRPQPPYSEILYGTFAKELGHSEPPSTGCLVLLSCVWTSTELIFGFTLVSNFVGNG
jgi:hypothetical protein